MALPLVYVNLQFRTMGTENVFVQKCDFRVNNAYKFNFYFTENIQRLYYKYPQISSFREEIYAYFENFTKNVTTLQRRDYSYLM
jgi:hypothetical protein